MRSIEHLKKYRPLFLRLTDDLTPEQMVEIPEGRNNNILWNVGHVVVTQQLLHYALAGQPMYVSDDLVATFRKGSSPADWTETPDLGEVRRLLTELPEKLASDYASGRHNDFNEYATSAGVTLETIEDSLEFNNFHEGLHLGMIMAIRRQVV